MKPCVFCGIVAGTESATIVHEWHDTVALVPIGAAVDGHILVIPRVHVSDASVDPIVTATTMARAASIAPMPSNILASTGPEASQTIYHLHVHVVPRAAGDPLGDGWPWARPLLRLDDAGEVYEQWGYRSRPGLAVLPAASLEAADAAVAARQMDGQPAERLRRTVHVGRWAVG